MSFKLGIMLTSELLLHIPLTSTIFYHIQWPWTWWGSQGRQKAKPKGFIFSFTCQVIRMRYDVVLMKFTLSIMTLWSSGIFFSNLREMTAAVVIASRDINVDMHLDIYDLCVCVCVCVWLLLFFFFLFFFNFACWESLLNSEWLWSQFKATLVQKSKHFSANYLTTFIINFDKLVCWLSHWFNEPHTKRWHGIILVIVGGGKGVDGGWKEEILACAQMFLNWFSFRFVVLVPTIKMKSFMTFSLISIFI